MFSSIASFSNEIILTLTFEPDRNGKVFPRKTFLFFEYWSDYKINIKGVKSNTLLASILGLSIVSRNTPTTQGLWGAGAGVDIKPLGLIIPGLEFRVRVGFTRVNYNG